MFLLIEQLEICSQAIHSIAGNKFITPQKIEILRAGSSCLRGGELKP